MTKTIKHPGVWCCSKLHDCTWQGFALHRGLAWGKVPLGTVWREYHARHCEGRLIQLIKPGAMSSLHVKPNTRKQENKMPRARVKPLDFSSEVIPEPSRIFRTRAGNPVLILNSDSGSPLFPVVYMILFDAYYLKPTICSCSRQGYVKPKRAKTRQQEDPWDLVYIEED
jgi:hypothetical protein